MELSYIFSRESLCYISENGNPKNFISGNRTLLYFRKWNFLAPALKSFLYFRANYLNQPFLLSLEKKEKILCLRKHFLYQSKETDFLRFKKFLML